MDAAKFSPIKLTAREQRNLTFLAIDSPKIANQRGSLGLRARRRRAMTRFARKTSGSWLVFFLSSFFPETAPHRQWEQAQSNDHQLCSNEQHEPLEGSV